MNGGGLDLVVRDRATVNHFAVRFNTDIAQIVAEHGEYQTDKAIWYIYGCVSGYMCDVLDPSLGADRHRFMESVKFLYADGFRHHCARFLGHLDSGPEPSRPLNSSCYMLWDMDGIECPAINGDAEMLEASLDILGFVLRIDHWACQESALHGLGHLVHSHESKTVAVIDEFIRKTKPVNALKTYAEAAMMGCIQ